MPVNPSDITEAARVEFGQFFKIGEIALGANDRGRPEGYIVGQASWMPFAIRADFEIYPSVGCCFGNVEKI